MEMPENPPYEWYANQRREFASRHSRPLELLIDGINVSGLIKKEDVYDETGPLYLSEHIESVNESERRGAGIYAKTPYADNILHLTEGIQSDEAKAFLGRIRNSVVLDLASGDGLGEKPWGYMLAQSLGARAYVGVEKFNHPLIDYIDVLEIKRSFDMHSEDIPFAMVKEDALDFLHRVPNNSVSVFTFALTGQIGIEKLYAEKVEKEIARVLSSDGAYVSYFSDFEPQELVKTKYPHAYIRPGGLLKFVKPSQ